MIGIRPVLDWTLVKRVDAPTDGAFVIPSQARELARVGEVVAVGQGDFIKGRWVPLQWKPGDIVIYGQYADHNRIWWKDEEYILLKETDINCIVDGDWAPKPKYYDKSAGVNKWYKKDWGDEGEHGI